MSLKNKIRSGNFTLGSWITLAHPAIPEIMANAGFEWLVVDLEHSSITIREAEELIRVISLSNSSPLVRLTSNNTEQIKRVMDAGAHGIIVPNTISLEDVKYSVDALKYPPEGKRGVGLARAQKYGRGFEDYLKWQKDSTILVIQIENVKAIDNLDEIFKSGFIDAFIIGPYDLSASMGIAGQFDHPEFIATMKKILEIAKVYGVTSGIHIVEPTPALIEERKEEGHRFIAYSLDTRMLDIACLDGIKGVVK